MKRALILIDVQNDYFSNGAMELVKMEEAALNCKSLLHSFRSSKEPLFHIQHISTREGASFFLPGTKGCEINEITTPQNNETIIVKNYPNAFRETKLHNILKTAGIEELIVCGAMTHMCVDTTVRAAFDLGYKCQVISDACATRDLVFNGRLIAASYVHAAFLAALQSPFAQIRSTRDFLDHQGTR